MSSSRTKKECFVSVIAAISYSEFDLRTFIDGLHAVLDQHYEHFEIVLVDDRQGPTPSGVDGLLSEYSNIRYIRLARRDGLEIAITAGFNTVIGDVVVTMLPGLDPVARLPELVTKTRHTGAILVGRLPGQPSNFLYARARNLFYAFARRFLDLELTQNTTYFMSLTRKALNSVNAIKDKFRYVKAFATFSGFTVEFFDYELPGGRRYLNRTFTESLELAVDIAVSNSVRPLRMVSALAVFLSVMNLFYVGYIVLIAFFKRHVAEGWITLSTQNAIAYFVLSLVLATVSEYLGRVLIETRDRPFYFVREERTSPVSGVLQERLRNVVSISEE